MNQDLQNLEIKVENDGTTPQGRLTATEWNILVAAVKSLDLTGGSADAASILQVVANAGYATQEWVTSQKYITSSALDNLAKNLVTLDTTQAIKGMKDFTNGLKIGGVSVYKSKEGIVFVDGNLAVRGAITMYADNGQAAPSIWDGFPYDNITIKRNAAGKFYAVGGGGSGTGGLDYELLDIYLTTNGYATQSWVTGKGYITSSAIPTSLKNPNALSWSGYSSGSYDGSSAQSIALPTKLSQLTDDVVSGKYLSIAGGTVNGDIYSKNYRTDGAVYIQKLRIENSNEINGYTAYNGGEATGNAHINYVSSGVVTLCYGGGNCGVGGIPTEKLHVHGNVLATGDVTTQKSLTAGTTLLAYTGSSSVAYLHITNEAATVDYAHLFVSNSDKSRKDRPLVLQNGYGNVAIGGTTASEKLHVYGNLLTTGAITMYYSSDRRLKQNIRKVDASKTLMSLGGVYQYEYIGSEVQKNSTYGGSHFGLIYQNVKGTALDKMCFEREDGMGALNYLDTNFISLIAGATMEHCTEIEKLKKENKALRKRVEQLEKRIA